MTSGFHVSQILTQIIGPVTGLRWIGDAELHGNVYAGGADLHEDLFEKVSR